MTLSSNVKPVKLKTCRTRLWKSTPSRSDGTTISRSCHIPYWPMASHSTSWNLQVLCTHVHQFSNQFPLHYSYLKQDCQPCRHVIQKYLAILLSKTTTLHTWSRQRQFSMHANVIRHQRCSNNCSKLASQYSLWIAPSVSHKHSLDPFKSKSTRQCCQH
jgi:hypothetical protein